MMELLDTHTLLWLIGNDPKLGASAKAFINNPGNVLRLSPATYWEIAVKVRVGKLTLTKPFEQFILDAVADYDLILLPIAVSHANRLTTLPLHHRDPFDRMLIAQALVENIPILTADTAFQAYPVTRIW